MPRQRKKRRLCKAQKELKLLIQLASGKKTFEQVSADAAMCGVDTLLGSNAARGVRRRLQDLTGISKDSLTFFPIRCKPDVATEGGAHMRHPFVLISTIVAKCLQSDVYFFEVDASPIGSDTVASSFINSPQYSDHPLVQQCRTTGETVVPISL